jgi:hypothetical protein
MDSPHYRHGLRTKDLREVGAAIARDVARMRREVAAGRHYFSMAALEDIHTRLALLEVAVFGQARGWFEVTPHPDDASLAAALYPREWPTKAGINEAWRAGLDAKYPEDAWDGARDPMNAGTAPTPDDGGEGS